MSMANSADRLMRLLSLRRLAALAAVSAVMIVLSQAVADTSAGASPSLQSTGSSFASVAIQQWVGQASTLYGLNINWQVSSSVVGLNNFAQNQVDFGASDIPYSSGQSTYYPNIPYQYMPDVAGGLSFMYNLNGNDGRQINNLVLNAHVVDQIFLGEITTWNNPAIAAINPQIAGDLPNTKIVPVYRSDASGENYLLSDYMLHQDGPDFTSAQADFQAGIPGQPSASWPAPIQGQTKYNTQTYPGWSQGNLVGESGSDNAANYVAALSSLGAITYVETAFAKEHNFPVASLLNASGRAVQPTSVDVATALEAAVLHADLTQDLTNVYTNPLPNASPLSAYSYLVTPCSPTLAAAQRVNCAADPNGAPSSFASQKGQALGQFVAFLACAGQEKMATLGYSPLPPNLVQEDFNAVGRLNGGQEPPPVSAADCRNPYVDGEIPLPGEPAIVGQTGGGVTGAATGGAAAGPGATGASAGAGSGSGGRGSSGSGGSAAGAAGSTSGSGTEGLTPAQIAAGYRVVNGHVVQVFRPACPDKYECADALVAATRSVPGPRSAELFGWTLLVLAVLAIPPLLATYRRRRATGDIAPGDTGSTGGTPS
ncbi:MAG: substrate-binding domain-containing protein [Acidimicrobiales bacterium]